MHSLQKTLLVSTVAAVCCIAHSQQQVRPPKINLWMDVSTSSFAGMPDMESMGAGGGLLGSLMGAASGATGLGGALKTYGQARSFSMLPSRVIDIALLNINKPAVEVSQAIPAGMKMGAALPLVPPVKTESVRREERDELPQNMERPKGRILIYWGCSETIRSGQPRIIDLSGDMTKFGNAFSGRYAPDRSVRVSDKHAIYPNDKNTVNLSKDSSIVGEHQINGDGIPASMRFSLSQAQDVMPAIALQSSGNPTSSIKLNWQSLNQAKAYFISAFSSNGTDMVLWSSSESADAGMGLMDYLPNTTIDNWLRDRVLLQPSATSCAVPQGIFAAKDGSRDSGAMAQMIAFGGESYIVYPPRPADAKTPWNQEWAVRLRLKSQTMASLGGEDNARSSRRANPMPNNTNAMTDNAPPSQTGQTETPADGGGLLGLPIPGVGGLLKGLFGR
ncbi:MAG: hypothetical protein ABL923_06835 [Burkholderiaceae bacterium]